MKPPMHNFNLYGSLMFSIIASWSQDESDYLKVTLLAFSSRVLETKLSLV